jgi:dolichyl-diphosphooligosaccharide--protein glycosyltransferase
VFIFFLVLDGFELTLDLCRFADLFGGNQAVDRVRNQQAPKNIELDYLGTFCLPLPSPRFHATDGALPLADEAFTSENWIVRIYQVRKEDILGRDLKSANAFEKGKKRKRSKPVTLRRRTITA